MLGSEKVMFEIYREAGYNHRYKVVYFTELNDHSRETEINRALAGEHYYDGFLKGFRKQEAKALIEEWIARLNGGEELAPDLLAESLREFMPV
jgi:hypothetical protein